MDLEARFQATLARIRAEVKANPPAHIEVHQLRRRVAELEAELSAARSHPGDQSCVLNKGGDRG
jgi:hypothetical protein